MNKKLSFCLFLILFCWVLVSSCEENSKKKLNRSYLSKTEIYSSNDSVYSDIKVYYGVVNGHTMMYTIYSPNRKSCKFEVEHVKEDCKKCLSQNRQNK